MLVIVAIGLGVLAAPARAVPPSPIPEGPDAATLPAFIGDPAGQNPVAAADPPRHPFMAPNGRSNLHVDAYQTDVHQGPGPLGRDMRRTETFLEGDCASVTFDSRGQIVTVCVGLEGPKLFLLDARTLETLASFPLPPRVPGAGNIFNDFAGGGYFYLDERGRAVIPTTTRHLYVVRRSARGFALERDFDLTGAVPVGDKIVSALPDWSGRFWFVSQKGVVGTVDRVTGAVTAHPLNEPITNSFAVGEDGGVYVVSDAALYRFDPTSSGSPAVTWREVYANSGISKPGQVGPGSGTTPTLLGTRLGGDHGQRRPDERRRLPARARRERSAPGLRAARVRARRERHRQLADRRRPLADRGEQLRLHRPGGHPERPDDGARASSASTSTPTARAAAPCGARASARRRWCRSSRRPTGSSTRTRRTRSPTTPTPGTSRRSTSATAGRSTSGSAARASATTTTTRRSRSGRTGPRTSASSAA